MTSLDRSSARVLGPIAFGGVLVALLGACTTAPREQLAVANASVQRASGPAAAEAPLELATAREKLERANVAMANRDYTLARQLAEQADADAALAEAQSRSTRSQRALAEVRESIRQLRDEMAKKTAAPQS